MVTMKPSYYLRNPHSILCLLVGHSRDEETEHTLCSGSTPMSFCHRCPHLYRKVDGEWISE